MPHLQYAWSWLEFVRGVRQHFLLHCIPAASFLLCFVVFLLFFHISSLSLTYFYSAMYLQQSYGWDQNKTRLKHLNIQKVAKYEKGGVIKILWNKKQNYLKKTNKKKHLAAKHLLGIVRAPWHFCMVLYISMKTYRVIEVDRTTENSLQMKM